jgi:O-antigen/teichoic acid export membrane protein
VRGLLASGTGVAAGLALWNLGNFIFFVVAGRLLGPEDYGLAAALLAVTLVVGVPFSSFQPALASTMDGRQATGIYSRAVGRAAAGTLAAVLGVAVLIAVAEVVHPEAPSGPLLASLMVVLPAAVFPLSLGRLQGEHRFTAFAVSMGALGLSRPAALVGLYAAGLGLYAAIGGSAVAAASAAAIAALLTREGLREPRVFPDSPDWRAFRASLVPNVAGVTAIALMTNLDIIAAKLALDDRSAGVFAAIGALAKAVFLVGQTVATIALPRVVARRAREASSSAVLAASVLATLVGGAILSAVVALLAGPIVRLTLGEAFESGSGILGAFTGAMGLMGVLIVLVYHQHALRSFRFSAMLLLISAAQVLLLVLFHGSQWQIIAVDIACAIMAIAGHDLMQLRSGDQISRGIRELVRGRVA